MFLYTLLCGILYVVYCVVDWWRRREFVGGISKKGVFITGCDTGFGAALAKRLDAMGCPVYAGCLTTEGAERLTTEASSRLVSLVVDVRSTASIIQAFDSVRSHIKRENTVLWGVVNNAGVNRANGPAEFFTREDYQSVFEVNLFGLAEVTRTFLPLLKESQGRLVNVSSYVGFMAIPSLPTLSASKFAIEGLTDVLRRELSIWGVRVLLLEPGGYRTQMVDPKRMVNDADDIWRRLPEPLRESYGDEFHNDNINFIAKVAQGYTQPNFNAVVDAYTHALFSVNPNIRYRPGLDSKIMKLLSYLPATLVDWCMEKFVPYPLPKVLRSG